MFSPNVLTISLKGGMKNISKMKVLCGNTIAVKFHEILINPEINSSFVEKQIFLYKYLFFQFYVYTNIDALLK